MTVRVVLALVLPVAIVVGVFLLAWALWGTELSLWAVAGVSFVAALLGLFAALLVLWLGDL